MTACRICATEATEKRRDTPYWECPGCGLLFQSPLPPKLYQHPSEYDLAGMPEGDKAVNRALAKWLFETVMQKTRGRTLDIGAKNPVMAKALLDFGCDARAMDAAPGSDCFGVPMTTGDFEADPIEGAPYALVTMVHVFEHAYDPTAMLRKLRGLVADSGALFLRIPDSGVPGVEAHMTEHHFAVHPYCHALSSIAELCARTRAFVIEWTGELSPGQRDLILRPIA